MKWLKDTEVSEMTGRAVQTLRNDRQKCQGIPYCKIGRAIRYKLDDVEIFMDSCRIEPRQQNAA